MPTTPRSIRQSVSLPPQVARRVRSIAKTRRVSANRVLVDLIEVGLDEQERERQRFMDLADRLTRSTNRAEQSRLKEELARLTFGE